MTEAKEERYQKALEGGWKADYIIRGLKEDEIATWAQFCASIFAYKANPPPASYFERHYYNDPNRGQASLIRVACYNGEIVASCRLFLKKISTAGKTVIGDKEKYLQGGGIGEVCTAPTHRKRGLSKVLLQNVMEIMKERQLQVSLLHAAPAFFPVYEKAGNYQCTLSKWSVATWNKTEDVSNVDSNDFAIRNATFPDDTDRLCQLHQTYSENNFAGCIVRSPEYWNDYLSKELGTSLWVLVSSSSSDNKNNIVAWLSLRPRGDRVQLREFGVDRSSTIGTAKALDLLLPHAMKALQGVNGETCFLVLPTIVLEQAKAECQEEKTDSLLKNLDGESIVEENDQGWMYKILDDQVPFDVISGETTPHLIWPADSF